MNIRRVLFCAVAATAAACGDLNVRVNTDYDPAVDFSKYKTYSWIQTPDSGNPLMDDRIVHTLDAQLSAKGWRKIAAEPSDVAVGVKLTSKEQERVDTFYNGWGGWGRFGMTQGMAQSEVIKYTVGTLIVDMFDARTRQPIWRGTVTDTVSEDPQKNTALMQTGMDKLFKGFPPGQTAGQPSGTR